MTEIVRTKGLGGLKAYFAAESRSEDELAIKVDDILTTVHNRVAAAVIPYMSRPRPLCSGTRTCSRPRIASECISRRALAQCV
ncbi:hypothetical protein BC834DRAFT_521729 [Gloeopeniophorella convolvens]|nr:hypothetical protein BC834DRAFT_521729 [Gloeopeniophorella convolvens]